MSVQAQVRGVDPRTGEPAGVPVTVSSPEQAVEAAARAGEAFRQREASRAAAANGAGGFDDAELLVAVADALEQQAADLVAVALAETGLPQARLTGEVARTVTQLRAFADARRQGLLADAIIDTAQDGTPPRPDQRRMAVPLGPVAVFSASNFPFAFSTAGGDTASAWAAGCPVVLKAHPAHPATSALTADVVSEAVRTAGAPAAWFQVLHGPSQELGRALVAAPDISAVGFTGSLGGGRALFDAAAARAVPIPVYAEMGSINPIVVTPGALARRGREVGTAVGAVIVASAGQLCTKPNLLIAVQGPGLDELVGGLTDAVEGGGDLVMLTPDLRDRFASGWRELTGSEQVRELVAAGVPDRPGAWQSAGLATVPAAALIEDPELVEEHFGPATLLAVAQDLAELNALVQRLPGTLTATLHAEPEERDVASALVPALAAIAGRLVFDGVPTGVTIGHATVHGGPYPATTASATTSVGLTAARRFQRPVGYQSWPDELLPAELQDANPLAIVRLVDGRYTRDPLTRS